MQAKSLSIANIEQQFTIDSLKEYFASSNGVELIVPFMSIGCNSSLDIAEDYLFFLFLSESIHPFCESVLYLEDSRNIIFSLYKNPNKLNDLISVLCLFSHAYNNEWDIDFENSIMEFKFNLKNRKLFLPELADRYMANVIAGKDDLCLDQMQIQSLYDTNPEEEFDFWHSFISPYVNYDVYVSSWAWIVPYRSNKGEVPHNLEQLLLSYGGIGKKLPVMEEADSFSVGTLPPVVLSNSAIMRFPREGFTTAQKCAFSILQKSERLPPHYLQSVESHQILLSEDGYLMIVRDSLAQYIFFINNWYSSEAELTLQPLASPIEQDYQNAFDRLADRLSSLAGNHVDILCPWENLDDELFEQLCYDLIVYSSNFDPDTRQKMGKSRSRDGGRDIEIYTRSRWDKPRVKWIIQCKLLSRGATLSGAKVQVSDVIDQYGAEGFCIMTTGVIDATLHDKLDGIERNRKIGVEKWDYLKIERVLAKPKYQNIRKRYFGA
jgi:hypothetical protein